MKSLNRTLSLVLVLAMVFGLMGIASATTFTDTATVQYKEAVDVVTGIGAINGLPNGSFNPKGTITREDAAKLVCYAVLGASIATTLPIASTGFSDVAATRWSASFIAYCVSQGIINGNGDGTFAPTGNVTGYQMAKMLLCAAGYGKQGEFIGNSWELNVAILGNKLGVFTGSKAASYSAAATREEAVLYVFNGITKLELKVWNKSSGNYDDADGNPAKSNTIATSTYPTLFLTAGTDTLGRVANIWTYKGLVIGTYVSGADFTFTAKAAGTTAAAQVAAMGFTGYTLNGNSVTPLINGADGTAVTTLAGLAALTANGTIVEVYVNGDDATQIDSIVVVNSYLAQITSINTMAKIVTVKTVNGTTYTVDSSVNPKIYTALSAMAVKDYVLITPYYTAIVGLAAPKTVSGTVTKIVTGSSAAVTVGGTEYKLSANQVDVSAMNSSTMTSKANVTLYLDSYGNAIYVTNATVTTPYFAVVKVSQILTGGSIVNMATGYAPDGTVVSLNVGTASVTKGSIYSYLPATAAEVIANNSEYTLSAVGQLQVKTTLVSGKLLLSTGVAITAGSTTFAGIAADDGATAAIPYTSDVKFIFIDTATGTITVKTGSQAVEAGKATALLVQKADGTYVIPVVYVDAAPADATGATILFVAKSNGVEYISGVAYNNYTAMIDGVPTPIATKGSADVAQFYSYAKDATTGIYTLATYTTTGVANSVAKAEVLGATVAGYLLNATGTVTLTNLNAANAVIYDLSSSGIATLSDITTLQAAGKTVTAAVVYNDLSTSATYNTVSYIYVYLVA